MPPDLPPLSWWAREAFCALAIAVSAGLIGLILLGFVGGGS